MTATNGLATTTPPQAIHLDRLPPAAPAILVPAGPITVTYPYLQMQGTAEPGATVVLLDGGYFTTTVTPAVGADGIWAATYPLHGGINHITTLATDATCEPSPASAPITVTMLGRPPLYTAGVTPTTVAAGQPLTLWATARHDDPYEGAPTVGVWADTPDAATQVLTLTTTLSGDTIGYWAAPWLVSGALPSDNYDLFYTALDADNLAGNATVALAVRNGLAAPTIQSPASPYRTADPDLTLHGTLPEAYLALELYAQGEATPRITLPATAATRWQATVTFTETGTTTFYAVARDHLGQSSPASNLVQALYDTTPPLATLTAPVTATAAPIPIQWTATDDDVVASTELWARYEGGLWYYTGYARSGAGGTIHFNPTKGQGTYAFDTRSCDSLGNCTPTPSGAGQAATLFDSAPPASAITAAPAVTATAPIELPWQAEDTAAGVASVALWARYEGGSWVDTGLSHNVNASSGSGTFSYTPLADGVYDFASRATDLFGHIEALPPAGDQTTLFDTTPPSPCALTLSPWQTASPFTVTWEAADATSGVAAYDIAYRTGASWTSWLTATAETAAPFTAPEGAPHAFRCRALDLAGNLGPWTAAPPTTTLDTTPPTLTLAAVSAGTEALRVTWSAADTTSGLDTCALTAGDGTVTETLATTCAGALDRAVEPGTRLTFRLAATDIAGNAAQATASAATRRVTRYYHHGGARVAFSAAGNLRYLHTDHLGSTGLTTDAAGNPLSQQRYHPFGTVRWAQGEPGTDLGFTGQRLDTTGLMYYHARYYDPALARFISADPIIPDLANPQQLNRYAYTLNNPLRYTDPTGHCAEGDDACWEVLNEIEDKYSNVTIVPSDLWNADQLTLVKEALDMMLNTMGSMEYFQEIIGDIQYKRVKAHPIRPRRVGGYVNTRKPDVVHLTNETFVRGADWAQMAHHVVIHETAHVIDLRQNREATRRLHSFVDGRCFPGMQFCLGYQTEGNPVSSYAGSEPQEAFAETYTAYILWESYGRPDTFFFYDADLNVDAAIRQQFYAVQPYARSLETYELGR